MMYVDPVPYRGDGLLWEMALVSPAAMLWCWRLDVTTAQEVLNHNTPVENCLLELGQIEGRQGYTYCHRCLITFQVCQLKPAAVVLLMGQTLAFRMFECLVVLVGCENFLRNTIGRASMVF